MASNPTPDNPEVLRALADAMADGCNQHEATLGIMQNTEALVRADIATLSTAETALGFKKSTIGTAYAALEIAYNNGLVLLTACKLRLAQKLGQRWSPAWEPTGFPNNSTSIPRTQDQRFTLLDSLKNYFNAVPAHEDASEGVTSAACLAQWTAISTARQGVNNAESALTAGLTTRDNAVGTLRRRVRGLINELEQLLSPSDPRWEDFGLNIPANPSAPVPVESVTLGALGTGRIEVSFPWATRATRYIVQTFLSNVDTEWQSAKTIKDLGVILTGFTAGQEVKVRVIAANEGGEANPSPEAEVIVT